MKIYFTVRDVAQRLEVKEETVRRWLRKGLLQGTPLGRAGYRIEPADLESFLRLRHASSALSPSSNTGVMPVKTIPGATNWQAMEALTDGFFVLDTRWHFTFLNSAAARMLGVEDLAGRNFWFVFDFLQDTPLFQTFYTAAQTRQTQECDEAALVPGRWLHLRVYPLAEGVAVSLIDITGRKQAELRQARLAHIVQDAGMVIFSATSSGIITSWNRGAELFYGYQAEETLGQSIALIVTPDLHTQHMHAFVRINQGDQPDLLETVHVHKSGRILPVSLHLSPLHETQNGQMSIIVVHNNLSISQEIATSMHLYEDLRYQVLESYLHYGIWISDAQGRVQYASQPFLNLLRMTLSDCQRQGWYHLVPQDEVPSIQTKWRRCWERGELWTIVYHLRGYDGHYYTILSSGQPVRDNDGTIIRWVGIHLNIDDDVYLPHTVSN